MDMKHLLILAAYFLCIQFADGQKVSADSLKYYEGKTVTVCSRVAETVFTPSKTTLINFEHGYPNQTFEVHIFVNDLPKFSYTPAEFLKAKTVCVTGQVKMFKGKPEIVVKSEEQIKIE